MSTSRCDDGLRARRAVRVSRAVTALTLPLLLALGIVLPLISPADAAGAGSTRTHLYLVTLSGPGSAGHHLTASRGSGFGIDERFRQDQLLDQVGAGRPVYRWTTALDGFAVRLTDAQATALSSSEGVVSVERNVVRRLTGRGRGGVPTPSGPPGHGRGAGVVIGVVDSGLWASSPVFAATRGLGHRPASFHGPCETGPGWSERMCNGKVVGDRWFVRGFGAGRIAASSRLSAADDDGHGTLSASIAAGDAGVSVHVPGGPHRVYDGAAPRARVAVYKACWNAPDPGQDGCATADLVTAIDRATRDGVDVLNLAVGGPDRIDTVERALLGAAESGVVVVASAGNNASAGFAAHPSPWVTTVGATTGSRPLGVVRLGGGPALTGAMAARRSVGPARLVLGADIAAPGRSRAAASRCLPGSLDAGRAAGRVVACRRGTIGRVDKSAAVAQADGVGMVLLNDRPDSVNADFHSVPTVHLPVAAAHQLTRWVHAHPRTRVTLSPRGLVSPAPRVTAWSRSGDPRAVVLKPDVLADGVGVLGAVPPDAHGLRWDIESGTSAATAAVSGRAAALLSTRGWTPAQVRSALSTTAAPLPARQDLLRQGAGVAAAAPGQRPRLAYLPRRGDYRRWLDGLIAPDALDVPSILTTGPTTGARVVTRRITNVGHRAMYFSSSATGFTRHQVVVTPAAVRLAPGASATYRVHVYGAGPMPLDQGWVTWLGADGSTARIPVVIAR